MARTVVQLATRQAELVAELADIRAEIAARAGEDNSSPARLLAPKRTRAKAAK